MSQGEQKKLAACVMVVGTTSGAGKSWLCTALCRYYARKGLRVAPFKAQNMSNNARVVAINAGISDIDDTMHRTGDGSEEGGEIGSAQYFQALAAGVEPDVRMNPLLLKPECDTHSQVVLLGHVHREFTAMPWRGRSAHVWPHLRAALDDLRKNFDVVVIEGAGSPAELNLQSSDIVNMRVAKHAEAKCLLVTDIDRGGAFAHLYGTWALLPWAEKALIKGFVLNKFRGDPSLLAPAPEMLFELTHVPTVATLPMWWQHGLPEEDGVFNDRRISRGAVTLRVAVIVYPRISNLDEFAPLQNIPGVCLMWVRSPAELAELSMRDWVILPGSKHTSSDLRWLKEQGLAQTITEHAQRGGVVLGICGGLQMLGVSLVDPHGVDGEGEGLGLLNVHTTFAAQKVVARVKAQFRDDLKGKWAPLAGTFVHGYEIHNGLTLAGDGGDSVRPVLGENLGWCNPGGNVLGIYVHGLFEDATALTALFAARLNGPVPTLDTVFDQLADFIDKHFEPGVLDALISS
jgi:adenosylcobyric acid synthase